MKDKIKQKKVWSKPEVFIISSNNVNGGGPGPYWNEGVVTKTAFVGPAATFIFYTSGGLMAGGNKHDISYYHS